MKRPRFVLYFFVVFLTLSLGGFSQAEEKKPPKALLSLPLFFPLEGAYEFNESSRYLSSVQYALVFSSLFPKESRKVLGRWSFRAGLSWEHRFPFAGGGKFFSNYSPSLLSLLVQWDLDYFPYITPGFGFGRTFQNPFKGSLYTGFLPAQETIYLMSFSLFFSFDIFDSHFSKRMYYEYSIYDMGLFLEYQRYGAIKAHSQKRSGWAFGFFASVS